MSSLANFSKNRPSLCHLLITEICVTTITHVDLSEFGNLGCRLKLGLAVVFCGARPQSFNKLLECDRTSLRCPFTACIGQNFCQVFSGIFWGILQVTLCNLPACGRQCYSIKDIIMSFIIQMRCKGWCLAKKWIANVYRLRNIMGPAF